MRLFVIGNGFDLDHGIESRFQNFKEFLECTYVPSFDKSFITYPNVGFGNAGELVVNPNNAAHILYALLSNVPISSDWKDFEDCLGDLNYQEILNLVEREEERPYVYFDKLRGLIRCLEASIVFDASELFLEWVEEIDIANAKRRHRFLNTDLFLSFNYTNLLEDLYGVPKSNICHIHGSLESRSCVIGHAKTNRSFAGYDEMVSFYIERIHNFLRKPVELIYSNHEYFFNNLYSSDVSEIIFFGLSFGAPDQFYVEKIFENIDSEPLTLYLSAYEDVHEKEEKLNILRNLGFKGTYGGSF